MNLILNYLPFIAAAIYLAAFTFVSIFKNSDSSVLGKHRLIFIPQRTLPKGKMPQKRRK